MDKYEILGWLIHDEKYYVPLQVDTSVFDLANNPYEIEKGVLQEAHKKKDEEIGDRG